MELSRDTYSDYETNHPKRQYIAHHIYMNIHLSRWLLILALQWMSFCLTEISAQVTSWSFSPAQLLSKGEQIDRTILSWRLGADSPRVALKKGKKLGLHFVRFSELTSREDPLGRTCSYRAYSKGLRFMDMRISKIYLHFMDDRLMNVVLYPTKRSELRRLKEILERAYPGRTTRLFDEPWIEDTQTSIRLHYGAGRRDRAFLSFVDRELADEMSIYLRQWRNLPSD